MPNINASLILSAIEGDEAVDVTPVGPVVNEPVTPEVVPSDQPAVISDADRNALFLMCMQTANPQGFQSFVKEHAIDMEVQGLVPSAEGLTAAVDSMKGGTHQVVHMAAALLAKNGDSSLYDAYTAAVNAEEAAVGAIMQTYGDAATTLVQDVISEYIAKSNSMQTIAGDGIRSMLDQARSSLPVNMAVENDLQFINTELEFCMETERMCEAFESELNDNFYEYAAYALEAEEGKPGIGQKIKGVAQGAWAKIKAFFRRIRDALKRFAEFLHQQALKQKARFADRGATIPMTATLQKIMKASNKFVNLGLTYVRKGGSGARILNRAASLVKNTSANDAEVSTCAQELENAKGELDSMREKLKAVADELDTLKQQSANDTKVIGKAKSNVSSLIMLGEQCQAVVKQYSSLTSTFETALESLSNDGISSRQKMAFAAATMMNGFTIGGSYINKIFTIVNQEMLSAATKAAAGSKK